MSGSTQKCRFCGISLYIMVDRYAQPILMPLTEEGAIWDEWVSKTGKDFVHLEARFCPMCGHEVRNALARSNDTVRSKAND